MPAILHKRTEELVVVLSGKADAYLDGRRLSLKKGDFLLIPAGVGHRFKTGVNGVTALSLFSKTLDPKKPDTYPVTERGIGARHDNPFRKRKPRP